MLDKVNHSLVEGVILALHVGVVDCLPQNMLVERPRKVAVQKLVVVDGLCNHTPDETEVVQVVGVDMGAGVGPVGDSVAWRRGEQSVVRVEHVPSDNDVKLSQEPPRVLPFFSLELNVEVPFEVFWGSSVELSEGVLEHVLAAKMNDYVFPSEPSVVQELQLVSEVAPFDVKVEDLRVVDEDGKRTFGDGDSALAKDLVQDRPVLLCRWRMDGLDV